MKTTAAILVTLSAPVEITEIEVPALKPGQTLVEMAFSGVCHTQLLEVRGLRGRDPYLPHCLGHEGSGTVLEVAAGVTKVAAGDRVILSWIKGSGLNVPGSVYDWHGVKVNAGSITTFGQRMVISEDRCTIAPDDLPLREAALMGCAVPTGFGAVLNTGALRSGESVVVFGVGGIGLCAIAAAKSAGAKTIIAVDIVAEKLQTAMAVGATHVLDAAGLNDLGAVILDIGGSVDLVIEATGRPEVMSQVLNTVKMQGGRAVLVGNAPHGSMISLDPRQFNQGKSLLGTWGGDSRPDSDFKRYAALIAAGRTNVEPLTRSCYALEDINLALDDLEAGRVMRPLIDFSL